MKKKFGKRYINKTVEYTVSFSGTNEMIIKLKEILINKCNINNTKTQRPTDIFSVIQWNGRLQVLRILDWLYGNASIYLRRKHTRYININRVL